MRGKLNEADELRKRAMIYMKGNLSKIEEFEKIFTIRRNQGAMEVDI